MDFFAALGAAWLVLELTFGLTSWTPEASNKLVLLVVCVGFATVFSCVRGRKKRSISLVVNAVDLHVEFLDIFAAPGQRVISVNEYFDSNIGREVSEKSLHGQFIIKILNGRSVDFDERVSRSIQGVQGEVVISKNAPNVRYPLGTTALIEDVRGNDYYVFAFSKTDLVTYKAKTTKEDFVVALGGLWKAVHANSNGKDVYIPLVGDGLSGVPLDKQSLLRAMIFSLNMQNEKIAQSITIAIRPGFCDDVDLDSIAQEWG